MFKKILLAVILLLFVGCSFGLSEPTLNIYWRNTSSENLRAMAEGGINVSKHTYSYTPNLSSVVVEIEADLDGKTDKTFDFDLATANPYEQVASNKIILTPQQAEKGSVRVSVDGQEAVFDYEIFPSGIVHSVIPFNKIPGGFDLEKGEPSETGHMYPLDEFTKGIKAKIHTVNIETEDFWVDFIKANNLSEYEYEETIFVPDMRKHYFIKTDNGYAVVKFHVSGSYQHGFIYKYSETGIFE